MPNMIQQFLRYLLLIAVANAFQFNFNGNPFGQQQQQQQQRRPGSFEEHVLDNPCPQYLCPDTQTCVSGPHMCPCPFPSSQLRCVLPNERVMCISKPASHDEELSKIYDDPVKGPKAAVPGLRDCGWLLKQYEN